MIPSSVLFRPVCKGLRVCGLCKARALLALTIAVALPACAGGQAGGNSGPPSPSTPANTETGVAGKLTFDVASVRPGVEGAMKGMDFLDPGSEAAPSPGGLFSWNVPLALLINFAYDLRSPQQRREAWQGLPKSEQEKWYTVEARAQGNPTRDELRQMVRSLLEERFQLAAHMEKRSSPAYALEVAKPGLGLKPHPEGAPCVLSPSQTGENRYPHLLPPYKTVPLQCGITDRLLGSGGGRRLEMLNVTMQQIADSLRAGMPVVDRTGLSGRYDAVIDFTFDDLQENPDSSVGNDFQPLPIALEKQLGLKLVKQNAPVDVFVIDHIGALSEN
jgi:uncharacterized protein (TIGR03435 family)